TSTVRYKTKLGLCMTLLSPTSPTSRGIVQITIGGRFRSTILPFLRVSVVKPQTDFPVSCGERDVQRDQIQLRELRQQHGVSAIKVSRVLGFESQLDGVNRIVEIRIRTQQKVRETLENAMQHGGDLSLIRFQINLTQVKRRFSKGFFDAFELL